MVGLLHGSVVLISKPRVVRVVFGSFQHFKTLGKFPEVFGKFSKVSEKFSPWF
jgi:hypothetical protein